MEALLAVGLLLLVPALLFAWAAAVARRRGTPAWRRARWLPPIALAVSASGALVAIAIMALMLVDASDAASRATALARGVTTGMNVSAFTLPLAGALYLTSLALSLYDALARRR